MVTPSVAMCVGPLLWCRTCSKIASRRVGEALRPSLNSFIHSSVPPPPGRLPPQIRKSVKSFFSPYFWSSEQPQSSCEQLLMRGTLGGTHRASIMDMVVDHHLARPGASPCPQPWLMKLVHTLQSRHLAHLDGLRLLWIVSGAQKSPKTSRKRDWVDVQVNGVSESRIATTSTRAHVSQ